MKRWLHTLNPWMILLTGVLFGFGGVALGTNLLLSWPVSSEHDYRPLFFAAIWLTVSGVVLPLVWLLHRRFGRPDAGESWRSFFKIVRQASWVGIWVCSCAWLQTNRTLNWAMALLILVVLILVEVMVLTRLEAQTDL